MTRLAAQSGFVANPSARKGQSINPEAGGDVGLRRWKVKDGSRSARATGRVDTREIAP